MTQHSDDTDSYGSRDWPQALKRNAAICELAAALFKARSEVYGGNRHLTEAPAHVRERFIAHAADVVDALKPEPAPAHVAPFAAVRSNDGLLNFAASLARKHAPALVRSKDGGE